MRPKWPSFLAARELLASVLQPLARVCKPARTPLPRSSHRSADASVRLPWPPSVAVEARRPETSKESRCQSVSVRVWRIRRAAIASLPRARVEPRTPRRRRCRRVGANAHRFAVFGGQPHFWASPLEDHIKSNHGQRRHGQRSAAARFGRRQRRNTHQGEQMHSGQGQRAGHRQQQRSSRRAHGLRRLRERRK